MSGTDWISGWARETATRIIGEVAAEVVEAHERGGGALEVIFNLERKAELRKFSSTAEITRLDFSNTIFACEMRLLPWRHRISRRNFVPEHLNPTREELNVIGPGLRPGGPLPTALRKIMSQFDERRVLVGHMFYNQDLSRWHLLYFDQRDATGHGNHWIAGPHVHLINWLLWPKHDANSAWREFQAGNPRLRGALHIRFSPEPET